MSADPAATTTTSAIPASNTSASTVAATAAAVAYVPVDHAGNVITLTSGGGAFRPEMLTEDELDYGIAPDSTSTPLKPPEEEYLRVSNEGGS